MPNKTQSINTIVKNVLGAFVTVVICGVLMFILDSQISNTVKSISQAKLAILEAQASNIDISRLQNQFKTIDGNDTRINNALPHENNVIPFVNALQALAKKDSVQESYTFSSPVPYTSQGSMNIYSISYSISLAGNISVFTNYLNDFQNLPYFTNISSITISSPSGLQQGSSMNMTATLYVQQ